MNTISPEALEMHKRAKELLCKEAEKLKESTQWKETAERLKAMQQEWKEIGPVPREDAELLQQRFRSACDAFFEQRTRNFQAQELERIDNLYRKIELCEKAEALREADDLQLALDEVQRLFQEWKSIGPVPREKSEALWERFRAAQDHLYQQRRVQFEALDQEREENLKIKLQLCEEAEALAAREDFLEVSPAVIALQERWKTVGPVPREQSDVVWERFRTACDNFFKEKTAHYSQLDEARTENLEKRRQICSEAIALKESTEWNDTTEKIKALQVAWKSAWPVPKEETETLWDEFRQACDHFFERKRVHFEEKRIEWQKNQAVWRMNMGKVILRKEEEIERIEAAMEYERSHIAEWQHRLENLPGELKSIDMKMEITERIDRAKNELDRKAAMIRQLQDDIQDIQRKLEKE